MIYQTRLGFHLWERLGAVAYLKSDILKSHLRPNRTKGKEYVLTQIKPSEGFETIPKYRWEGELISVRGVFEKDFFNVSEENFGKYLTWEKS